MASRRKEYANKAFSKRHRRSPRSIAPGQEPILQGNISVDDIVDTEVTPGPAPEPTASAVTPKEPDASRNPVPTRNGIGALPVAMRQALLSRQVQDDWEGRPDR